MACFAFCQNKKPPIAEAVKNDTIKVIDTEYREDQFYAGITYNLLGAKPSGVSQSGFSSGYHFGFIRDFPINQRRNVAIGVGLGVTSNSYNNTLLISKAGSKLSYNVLNDEDVSYDKNKFTNYAFELPLEFRWRTSTATSYDFWRIYTGLKIGYVVYSSTKFQSGEGDIRLSGVEDINRFQYGLTFSAGYSNISFYIYYGLNKMFKPEAIVSGSQEPVGMNAIKIGLMFYIL
jgi:hypothetical protein